MRCRRAHDAPPRTGASILSYAALVALLVGNDFAFVGAASGEWGLALFGGTLVGVVLFASRWMRTSMLELALLVALAFGWHAAFFPALAANLSVVGLFCAISGVTLTVTALTTLWKVHHLR